MQVAGLGNNAAFFFQAFVPLLSVPGIFGCHFLRNWNPVPVVCSIRRT